MPFLRCGTGRTEDPLDTSGHNLAQSARMWGWAMSFIIRWIEMIALMAEPQNMWNCIWIRMQSAKTEDWVLVTWFLEVALRGALDYFSKGLADVMNHYLKQVHELYKQAHTWSAIYNSLKLLKILNFCIWCRQHKSWSYLVWVNSDVRNFWDVMMIWENTT